MNYEIYIKVLHIKNEMNYYSKRIIITKKQLEEYKYIKYVKTYTPETKKINPISIDKVNNKI